MQKIIDEFIRLYKIVPDRIKLENGLINTFNSLTYEMIRNINQSENVYICAVSLGWNQVEISTSKGYDSPYQALLGLFIENNQNKQINMIVDKLKGNEIND